MVLAGVLVGSLGWSRAAFGASPSPDPERAFLTDAVAIGRAMIETGRLAAHRGKAAEVRSIGNTAAGDWTAWLQDLERLAADRVVTLPTTLDLDRQSLLERLLATTGEAFDAAYLDGLTPLHAAAEALFEQAAHSNDSGIQGFAEHALPQLRADRRSIGRLSTASIEARATRTSGRRSSRRAAMSAALDSSTGAHRFGVRRPGGGAR